MTQTDLGDRLGVRQQLVARWETNDTNPKLHHLVALAQALGRSTDELLGLAPMAFATLAVEEAITADPSLPKDSKSALLRTYRSLRASLDGASS